MKRLLIILCALLFISVNSYAAAPLLHVSSDNPRYFADSSNNIVYLRGLNTNDGYEFQDHAFGGTELSDFNITLNMYAANNLNFIRMWVSEGFGTPPNSPSPQPYLRSNVCCAEDGGNKFDLSLLNIGNLVTPSINSDNYFERLRARAIAARDNNIYLSVMLWHSFGWENGNQRLVGNNAWRYHPFKSSNNIQGVNCDENANGWGDDLGLLNNPCQSYQEAYIRQAVDSVNDLDNILYEVCNECYGGGSYVDNYPWQNYMATYIKNYELTKPKQHPVGITSDQLFNNTAMSSSNADWMGYAGPGEWNNPSVASGQRVSIQDIDHIAPCSNSDILWPWKSFTRGHNPLYFYCGPFGSPTSTEQSIITRVGQTATYASKLNLKTALPITSCSTGFCIGSNGQYLAYLPTGGNVNLTLSGSNLYTVEWFNPSTNVIQTAVNVSPGSQVFTSPWLNNESVVLVKDSGIPAPVTQSVTYNFNNQYSGVQGQNQWYYKNALGTNLTYNSAGQIWQIADTYLGIWVNGFHPGNSNGAMLEWQSPSTGTITITGSATDYDSSCGDGVVFSVLHNNVSIHSATINNGIINGGSYNLTRTVLSGDKIDFIVTKRSTNNCDSTSLNPVIVLTTGSVSPPNPTIGLSPTTLGFNIQENGSSLSQNVSLSNTVAGSTLNWAISHNASWLSISPILGTNNATFVVTANPTGLVPGTYNAVITVSGDGATNSPQTINVTLTVTAVPPATLTLKQALQNAIDQCQALTTCTGKDFSDKLEPLLNQVP